MALDVGGAGRGATAAAPAAGLTDDVDPVPDLGPRRLRLSVDALVVLRDLLDLPLPLRSPREERRRLAHRMGAAAVVEQDGPDPRDELRDVGALSGAADVHRDVVAALAAVVLGTTHLDLVVVLDDPDGGPAAQRRLWTTASGPSGASLATDDRRTAELSTFPVAAWGAELLRALPAPSLTAAPSCPPLPGPMPWETFVSGVTAVRAGRPAPDDGADLERVAAAVRGRLRLVAYTEPVRTDGLPDLVAHEPDEPAAASWLLLGRRWHALRPVGGPRGTDVVLVPASPADLPAVAAELVARAGQAGPASR